jgi:undecaprenyl-diphosphatase
MSRYIIIGASLLILFLGLSALVSTGNVPLHSMDIAVNDLGLSAQNSVLTSIMSSITSLGTGTPLTVITIVLLILFIIAERWEAASGLALGYLSMGPLTAYLKELFMIARPNMPAISSVGNWSFPSGHTTGITIVFLIAAFGLDKVIKNRLLKIFSISTCGLVIFLVGVSRIYLGVHWLSDVLGGWLLAGGIGFIIVGVTLYRRKSE